jgi:hypothetical protein
MSEFSSNNSTSFQSNKETAQKLTGGKWLIDAFVFYYSRIRDVMILCIASNKTRIYIFGDSHSQIFPKQRGLIKISVGPVTLNRAGKIGECKKLTDLAFSWPRKLRYLPYPKPSKYATVVISLGEIDFRVHVAKESIRQQVDPDVIVERLLDSAVSVVSQVSDLYGSKIIFLAVVPPTDQYLDPGFPTSGSLAHRILWVNAFNQELDNRLKLRPEFRSRVVDVSGGLTNEDGSLNAKFSDGTVHYHRSIEVRLIRCVREMANSIT